MKTTNLMINDYVQLKDEYYGMPKGTTMQIAEVFIDSAYCQDINIVFEALEVPDYLLEPIPLTDKILEENGFQYFHKNFASLSRNHLFQIQMVRWPYEGIGALWTLCDIIEIEFVHELQRALRICKIDKNIVL